MQMRGVAQDRLLALLVTVASVALVSPIVVAMQPPSVKKLSLSNNNNNNNNNQQQKQQQQKQQLRLKPQPSSSSSSGLPVPDLLESPDTKYDPKAKDIDNDALRLRLKGLIVFYCPFFSLFWVLLSIHYFFCLGRTS